MSGADPGFLDYRPRWRSTEGRPGKHPARSMGAGGDVRTCRPFWQVPDARRIDLRRTLMDPSGEVLVRQTEQRASLTLVLAADVSRSMRPAPDRSGLAAIATLAEAAARSALRAGDAFGFLPFDAGVRDAMAVAPTRARAAPGRLAARLARFEPDGAGAQGMLDLAARLPSRRALVLLASDFLMPLDLLDRALASLARHDVVPVVLAVDTTASLPRAGLLRLQDAESGQARLVLMRPALHRRWAACEAARRQALKGLFVRHGLEAFWAGPRPDLAGLSLHLQKTPLS